MLGKMTSSLMQGANAQRVTGRVARASEQKRKQPKRKKDAQAELDQTCRALLYGS